MSDEGRNAIVSLLSAMHAIQQTGRGEVGEKCRLPGVFRCAGLMVPDPSIMLPPMPFIEVVTGWEVVEYMVAGNDTAAGSGDQRPRDARKRASPQVAGGGQRTAEQVAAPKTNRCFVNWTGRATARLDVACSSGRKGAND